MSEIIKKDCLNILQNVDISSLKNKKVLITGASGLIGIYIVYCLKLANLDCDIDCWVNNDIDPIYSKIFEKCNIIKGDITSEQVFSSFCNNVQYDLIVHCAGYGQPNKFLSDKIKTITINTTVTNKLLQLVKNDGSFAFFSTSEIYNGNNNNCLTEDDFGFTTPLHPRASYIEGKRCGETICDVYSQQNQNINMKILRLSLAYGPGTKRNDQRVLNSLIEKGLFNETINLLDDGSSLRTYGYISDIIEMFWNILLHGKHKVYNLSGISQTSILELANMIGNLLNKKVVKSENNIMIGSPKNVNISLNRYFEEFEKKQFISLNEGIINTIEWQRKIYDK